MTGPAATDPQPGMRFPVFFWALVVLSMLAIGLGAWWILTDGALLSDPDNAPPPAAAQPAHAVDFQLTDLAGRQTRLSDLRGKVVLLNFWATWCPPCKAEMPDLQALYQDYGSERDFVVLGVDVEESQEVAAAFAGEHRLTFPLLPDPQGQVSNYRYFIRSLPTSFIIDRDGKVRYTWTGQLSRKTMLSRLDTVW